MTREEAAARLAEIVRGYAIEIAEMWHSPPSVEDEEVRVASTLLRTLTGSTADSVHTETIEVLADAIDYVSLELNHESLEEGDEERWFPNSAEISEFEFLSPLVIDLSVGPQATIGRGYGDGSGANRHGEFRSDALISARPFPGFGSKPQQARISSRSLGAGEDPGSHQHASGA
jgi:hypothetical protein